MAALARPKKAASTAPAALRPPALQKVCDVCDFFDPEIDQIIRGDLRSVPFGSRRAWEFAMIFRALRAKGKLNGAATGIGMGAGTERLIYVLARHAKKLLVTDLYLPDQGWKGVRTTDPKGLVMSRAPWPVNANKIDAAAMDMRALTCADESFDFAWSTGAFEHIGADADFSKHFEEVHRVLKPGGVYAFTTAVVFGDKTLAIPHNHYFHPQHLLDLIDASPFSAEPEFDLTLQSHLFNQPHFERFQDYGVGAASQFSKPIVSFRRGALLAANVMVLTKDAAAKQARTRLVGYDESCRRLAQQRDQLVRRLWDGFTTLTVEGGDKHLHTQPQYFGDATVTLELVMPASWRGRALWVIDSRAVDEFREWRVDKEAIVNRALRHTLRLPTQAGRIYRLTLQASTALVPDDVIVRARHSASPGDAAAASQPVPAAWPGWVALARRLLGRGKR